MKADLIVRGIEELATPFGNEAPLRGDAQGKVKIIKGAAIAVSGEKIIAVGPEEEVISSVKFDSDTEVIDASGKAVIPGFVDPHTHLVYAGCRHEEFLLRLRGAKYEEILKKGGGILDTVKRTRDASREDLLEEARRRAWEAFYSGTTTIEIKSGYGLDRETELKILDVAKRIGEETPLDVVTTYLGAHAIPPEYRNRREEYIEFVVEMLPVVREKADFVDVFCDDGAFTEDESREILKKAKELGFGLKIHADEITSSGGSRVAGELGALSADHLENIDNEGVESLKRGKVLGTLLPGTSFFLKLKKHAPARKLIDKGIPIALGTDHNPGSCPILSQAIIMSLGVFLLDMMPDEALNAVTINAAHAIGLGDKIGSLEVGKQADFLILKAHSYIHIPYEFGRNLVETVVKRGKIYTLEKRLR